VAKLPKPALAPVDWIGSAKDDVTRFPQEIKNELGQSLFVAQLGQLADNAKLMKGGELREVTEIVARDDDGTYRLMYTVKLGNRIYVLHAFQKKSTHGIATPKRETDLIRQRLLIARARAASIAEPKTEASSSKGKKK
jgi:phage-related protein